MAMLSLIAFSVIGQTNPKVEKQDVDKCIITKIEKNIYATTVFFQYTSDPIYKTGAWACAGKDFFIEDTHTGKRFKMLKANNIPICPGKHQFTEGNQVLNFSIDFEPINETNKINIIENELQSAFNFFGVDVYTTNETFFSIESTTIYLVVAVCMTLLINLFFRQRFKWWALLLLTIIPNFLIGIIVMYIIATMQYDSVLLNFNEQNLAGKFGESLGNSLIAFVFITPFFRKKKSQLTTQKKENNYNPLKQFKNLPQGTYRLIIAGWIILPLIASSIVAGFSHRYADENFVGTLILSIPIYYVLARLGSWVYLGFQNDKPKINELHESSIVPLELLKENEPEKEANEAGNTSRPKSFHLSIILTFILLILIAFIVVLLNQIINYRTASDGMNDKIKKLNGDIKTVVEYEQYKYKLNSLIGSKIESETCAVKLELDVENKLNIPVRLYISRPRTDNNNNIRWEPFIDFYWILQPGFSGTLNDTNKETLSVKGYRYYVTDTDGNPMLGSRNRPVYTSICENILGLKIY